MPIILREDMREIEILRHIAETYSNPSNYEAYEKDYGDRNSRNAVAQRQPWIARDQGDYARHGLTLVKKKGGLNAHV